MFQDLYATYMVFLHLKKLFNNEGQQLTNYVLLYFSFKLTFNAINGQIISSQLTARISNASLSYVVKSIMKI